MKDAQKPQNLSLTTLVGYLRHGRFVIPDFQRDFEWQPWDIKELMRSIFLDYYIGSLLLWKGKEHSFDALACEPLYGFSEDTSLRQYIVLDGQQRLTAMYYAFVAPDVPAPNRANRFLYFIRVDEFVNENFPRAFDYDWTRKGANVLEDTDRQYGEHLFPLATIGEGGWALFKWVQGYEDYWKSRASRAAAAGDSASEEMAEQHARGARIFRDHLQGIHEQYQIAYIELDQDISIDKVCDIFTQINSRGVRLDVFDLMNALLKPKGLQLKHMWREAAPRLAFVESGRLNVYVLQVMSILRQNYCSPKYLYYLLPGQERQFRDSNGSLRSEVLVSDTQDFAERWKRAVDALERAIELIRSPQGFGAITSSYLPYVSILPAFTALQEAARTISANQRLNAQRKVRHWYWASVFTNRYSGSVESTAARDYLEVTRWFGDDNAEPSLIAEFRGRFGSLDLRREVKRGTSVYNGIFNLLVLSGAQDWITGNPPQPGDLDDHHIVPQHWGRENLTGTVVDSILNRTPLTTDSNRNVIKGRLPNDYLSELMTMSSEDTVRSVLETHLISNRALEILLRKPFGPDDFEEFLDERQRTIRAAIEDLLIKGRLDLAPPLRELDERIERTELSLRALVAERLHGDTNLVPSHVLQRVKKRLTTAARRNPTLDSSRYATLEGMLEYADLREVQDTIQSKSNWHLFIDVFPTKEQLQVRFQQLAELRNTIRHSRAVDEVTRMDGEASLHWFRQVLPRAVAASGDARLPLT